MPRRTDEKPEITVRRAAMNLLARREHSYAELVHKLTQKFPELDTDSIIQPALERLREQNLQSDARFLESYVRYRSSRGFGPLKITMELQQKGISQRESESEVYSQDYVWTALCREAMDKKFDPETELTRAEKDKCYRFLAQRGFESEQIRTVMKGK
jgi:regulatory protein